VLKTSKTFEFGNVNSNTCATLVKDKETQTPKKGRRRRRQTKKM
jgi:hypothetical protein